MTETPINDILIHGSGSTARVTALALAQARLPVTLAEAAAEQAPHETAPTQDWQSVLALSPAAKNMLETLGVWQKLDCPSAPICDMAVFGDPAAYAANLGLDFADTATENRGRRQSADAIGVLAHIVSRTALARAIESACNAALAENRIGAAAPLTAFDKSSGQAHFADGTTRRLALLVDCAAHPEGWRRDAIGQPLRHDYQAAALICALSSDIPHGNQAIQIFTVNGPLALLPLPDAHHRALIWSVPHQRATALAAVDETVLSYELQKATAGQLGRLTPITARAAQPLALALAETYVDEKLCLLGEAAHIIHPLAGQGFNLALRDGAQLAEALFEARRLGLAFDAPGALDGYQKLRRADSGVMAMTTHMLAEIFSGQAKTLTRPVARLGLALIGKMAGKTTENKAGQRLNKGFLGHANGGIGHDDLPRLMRGHDFGKAGLDKA
jgi:ubiquinone biosynthesis UbiH/UbiF/VisC/COQ6 family hydroxylase